MWLLLSVLMLSPTQLLVAKANDVVNAVQSLSAGVTQRDFNLLAKIFADLDVRGDNNQTALHLATIAGDLPTVKILLQLGANPDLRDDLGRTPFDHAEQLAQSTAEQLSIVHLRIGSLLLEKMFGVDGVDQSGWSPLQWAIAAADVERVEELFVAGASFDLWGVNAPATLAYCLQDQKILEIIADHSLGLENLDELDRLLLAIETDNKEWVEKLLAKSDAQLAFGYAGRHRLDKSLLFLSDHLPDINALINYRTPLQHTIVLGKPNLARKLLQQGADPNVIADYGYSPLLEAIQRKYFDLANELLDYGADAGYITRSKGLLPTSAINEAIRSGNLELTRRIIELGGDVNQQMHNKPMLLATAYRDLEMLQLLISAGGDVNVREDKSNLPTCLHLFACQGNIEGAQLVLNHDAEINALNFLDETPLMIASRMNRPEMVQFLLKQGADHLLINQKGETALEIARSRQKLVRGEDANKRQLIVELLARVDAENNN